LERISATSTCNFCFDFRFFADNAASTACRRTSLSAAAASAVSARALWMPAWSWAETARFVSVTRRF
jgi:hypothetical protein